MTDDAGSLGPAHPRPASSGAPGPGPYATFGFMPASEHEPATVHAAGDIDLINVGQFQAALEQAAAASSAVTVDMTAVTYCDSAAIRALFGAARRAQLTIRVTTAGAITESLFEVSGLSQIATVVRLG